MAQMLSIQHDFVFKTLAMMEMIVNVLPDIAKSVAEPLTSIEKVSIIGGDSSGVSQVSNNVPVVMQQVFETVKETTGLVI